MPPMDISSSALWSLIQKQKAKSKKQKEDEEDEEEDKSKRTNFDEEVVIQSILVVGIIVIDHTSSP